MTETDRPTQTQGQERARDSMRDAPLLDYQRTTLTKEMENLRKLNLSKNLVVEIKRKKDFIERESARLLSLEERRIQMALEISQRQQGLDKQKKELEELCKTMAGTEGPDMAVDSNGPATPELVLLEFNLMRETHPFDPPPGTGSREARQIAQKTVRRHERRPTQGRSQASEDARITL